MQDALTRAFAGLTRIQTLILRGRKEVSDESICALSAAKSSLMTLDANFCGNLHAEPLFALAAAGTLVSLQLNRFACSVVVSRISLTRARTLSLFPWQGIKELVLSISLSLS